MRFRFILSVFIVVLVALAGSGVPALAESAAQGLANGVWCAQHQFKVYGRRCASGGAGLATFRGQLNGNNFRISVDWHNGSLFIYHGRIDGSILTGWVTYQRTDGFPQCPTGYKFQGQLSSDGRRLSIKYSRAERRVRNCVVMSTREKVDIYVRIQ